MAVYDWNNGPATLQPHSIAKHKLLRSYLADYFKTLVSAPGQEVLRLTLVDGFAGGGSYHHAETRELCLGSPFICLDAAKEAEFLINNHERVKKVHFDIDYFLVEKDRVAAQHLGKVLQENGYGPRLTTNIHLTVGDFNDHAESIIEYIKKKSPRNGRSIFILDQYGYTQVPMPLIGKIFDSLPRAEVILTFHVDAFNSFASDKSKKSPLEKIGLPNIFEGIPLEELKRTRERSWRAWIQSQLYPHIIKATGTRFHTPFFIRSTNGHGDFWLLHLSMHQKARDVMTEVHWTHSNTFMHYGGEGLDMFKIGYILNADERFTKQGKLGFSFDDDARTATIEKLHVDLPKLIHAHENGISYETLFATTCNESPATSKLYKEVLGNLAANKEVRIVAADGSIKTGASQIKDSDRIFTQQGRLSLG